MGKSSLLSPNAHRWTFPLQYREALKRARFNLDARLLVRECLQTMMTSSLQSEEARLKLELFNEKSKLLEASRFLAWLMKGPRQPDFAKIVAGDWLAFGTSAPDPTATHSTAPN